MLEGVYLEGTYTFYKITTTFTRQNDYKIYLAQRLANAERWAAKKIRPLFRISWSGQEEGEYQSEVDLAASIEQRLSRKARNRRFLLFSASGGAVAGGLISHYVLAQSIGMVLLGAAAVGVVGLGLAACLIILHACIRQCASSGARSDYDLVPLTAAAGDGDRRLSS